MRSNTNTETENKKKRKLLPSKPAYLILLIVMMLVGVGFLIMLTIVDAFPASMVVGFIIVLLVLLALAVFLLGHNKKGLRITGIVLAALFILIYGVGIYYLSSTYSMFARISSDETSETTADGVNVTEDSFNVYITGIDQWNKEKGLDLERSDVNMIVTVCPKTRKILLTSIPRDTYVKLHTAQQMDKLTHTGVYGVDETINTVNDWLGIDMNYYLKANFSAFVDVVNAIDGIDVYSPYAFKSSISKYKYTKGWNHLKGRPALYFARERKAFNGKDSKRVENQQIVVKAMLDKMMSSSTLLVNYVDVLNAAGDSLTTNMSTKDMQALIKMQLSDLGKWDIQTQKLKGKYDMDYVASLTQEEKFLVYKANDDSYESVVENIRNTMNPSAAEIASATAARQKNTVLSFFKNMISK